MKLDGAGTPPPMTSTYVNPFLVPDLLSDFGHEEDAYAAEHGQEPVETAVLADRGRHLPGRDARQEVGDDAYPAIVETAEQTMLPLTHLVDPLRGKCEEQTSVKLATGSSL